MDNSINIDGIVIPDKSPIFLIIAIHVLAALICIFTALVAMFTNKMNIRHPKFGTYYFWSLLIVYITSILVSVIRWPYDNHLLILGTFAFTFAYTGRLVQRKKWKNRMRWHLVCMAFSFIFLLTAFYVDNGKNLPLWKLLPTIYYWIIPGLVGIPIMILVFFTHPLTRINQKT